MRHTAPHTLDLSLKQHNSNSAKNKGIRPSIPQSKLHRNQAMGA